ncbi:unnamed protein product [Bursaphelenchus xylophilus]|uniref:(pine wood nematode) hypothetical protein n=1 Tax=Bursaphelenchus xylophilus TaxID=6326 RepID=A0A1I7RUL7_BURXY|nr:unnamed protein product [Bursaphelenchus xylophilus]CAG9114209.1 unnamed protein product [Bursaphelenchus xylophilus]
MAFKLALTVLLLVLATLEAKKYCGGQFNQLQKKVCTYDKQDSPCLGGPHLNREIQDKCCKEGCSLGDISKTCCFTDSCLKSCYPGLEHQTGKKRINKMGNVY